MEVKAHPFSNEVPQLLVRHLEQLHQGSGISIDLIKERGYRSVLDKKELLELNFAPRQAHVPGILIPLHGTDGKPAGWQYKPDTPRVSHKGKTMKYENPRGCAIRLDCPPRCQAMLADPTIPVYFVEGVKKADSLASRSCCAVTLSGVWGFKGRNPLGGTTVLADFDYIALKDREVFVCYDSDYKDNPWVARALERIVEHLRRKVHG